MLTGGKGGWGFLCIPRFLCFDLSNFEIEILPRFVEFFKCNFVSFFFFLVDNRISEWKYGTCFFTFIIRSFISSYIRVNQDFRDMKIFIASFFSILIARTF